MKILNFNRISKHIIFILFNLLIVNSTFSQTNVKVASNKKTIDSLKTRNKTATKQNTIKDSLIYIADSSIMIGRNPQNDNLFFAKNKPNNIFIGLGSSVPTLFISKPFSNNVAGAVGIGTTKIPEGYLLAVKGKLIAEDIYVQLFKDWPDYVFDSNYKKMTLTDLEKYINKNSHLPGVPTAATVAQKGVSLGQMDVLLLQKVEELTLYLIEQNKILEEQKKLIESQTIIIEQQNKKIEEIKRNINKTTNK